MPARDCPRLWAHTALWQPESALEELLACHKLAKDRFQIYPYIGHLAEQGRSSRLSSLMKNGDPDAARLSQI
jgi:hypothetical protein